MREPKARAKVTSAFARMSGSYRMLASGATPTYSVTHRPLRRAYGSRRIQSSLNEMLS